MKKALFTGGLALVVFLAYGQSDQKKFEEVFNEEVGIDEGYFIRENHSAIYQYVPPQQVPEWFVHPAVSNQDEVYAIGISDPGKDTAQSFEQAFYRAEIMANVLLKSTTQLLCDFFLNEVDNSNSVVYEHFSRISSKIPNNKECYSLVSTYRNSFDETLVLIKYSAPKYIDLNQVDEISMELYRNETEISKAGEMESIYELQVKSAIDSLPEQHFYQLTEFGTRYDVLSGDKGDSKAVPIYTLGYKGIPAQDSVGGCYFSHGLWKEYLKSVMTQIIQNARTKPENIKVLGDRYNTESYQKLTRGISINKQRFVITGIKTNAGKLMVEMQELPLDE